MRHLLLAVAAIAAVGTIPAFAEEAHDKAKTEAHEGKPANKIDPLTGDKIDATVGTLELTYEQKPVLVGFSTADSLAKAKAADDKTKAQIAQAAKTHKIIKDGELVDIKHHKKA